MIREMGISVPVMFIEENEQITAICPVLDIATCGDNFNEAKENFEELVFVYFEELCHMGTLEEVLLESGWKKVGDAPPRWEPPRIIGSITENLKVPCPA